jgi:hypothetical protein
VPHSCQTSWRTTFLAAAILCALPVVAQKAKQTNQPKYDLNSETKLKGTIEKVNLPAGGAKEIAHLLVKVGAETVDVYLCPKAFLDDMGISFNKDDEITVAGSKVKEREADLILAREIVRGTDTLVLRDAKGNPIWN